MEGAEDMDLLQGIKDGEGQVPPPMGGDFKMPSIEQLLEALEKMDISDEEKENLKETLTNPSKFGGDMMSDFFKPAMEILPTGNPFMIYVLVVAFLVVLTLFVFFGYKLYKSVTEKQRKRDEKRKQRQMKKRK